MKKNRSGASEESVFEDDASDCKKVAKNKISKRISKTPFFA